MHRPDGLLVVIPLFILFHFFYPVACPIVISRHQADYHALYQNWVQYWRKVQKSGWAQRNIFERKGFAYDTAKIWVESCPLGPPWPPAPWGSHDSSLHLFSYLLKLINAPVVVIPLFIPVFLFIFTSSVPYRHKQALGRLPCNYFYQAPMTLILSIKIE